MIAQGKWFEFFQPDKEISLKNSKGIGKARAQVTEEEIRLWFENQRNIWTVYSKKIF